MPKAKTTETTETTEEEKVEEERQANLAQVPSDAEFPYHKGGGWYITEEGDVVQGDPQASDEGESEEEGTVSEERKADVEERSDAEVTTDDNTYYGPTQYDDPEFGPNDETEKAARALARDEPKNEAGGEPEPAEQPVETPEPDTSREARNREAELAVQNVQSGVVPSPSDTGVPEDEGPQLQPTPAHGDGHPMTRPFASADGDDGGDEEE